MSEITTGGAAASEVETAYRLHGKAVWRAVLAYSGDAEIASDAVSEAFAQALRRGEAIEAIVPWVWSAAMRIAAGLLKERGRRGDGDRPAERSYELPEPVRDLVVALGRLSPHQRSAVLLHHYAGYPVADVARILGTTPAAVRVHLHRGRNRLRTLLGDDDG